MQVKKVQVGQLIREAVGEVDDSLTYINPMLPFIGEVLVWFNDLEADLDEAICGLVSTRAATPGLLIMANTMFQTKLDLFERLASDWFRSNGTEPSFFKNLISELRTCAILRNKVVHANWLYTNSEGYTEVKIKARNDGIIEHEMTKFTTENLNEIIERIDNSRNLLSELVTDHLPL